MIDRWKSLLTGHTAEWNLPRGGNWTFLFYNNYHPHYSSLNVLWFHNGDRFPRVVTKVFHEPVVPVREFANLTEAYRSAPNWVPKPLHLGSHDKFWTLWMEGVPGLPVSARAGRSVPLQEMTEMVTAMHLAIRQSDRKPDPDRYRRIVSKPLQAVAGFGESASVRDGCARLASSISAGWLDLQPVIPQHGDLFRSHILCHKRQCRVIDWESFGVVDFPFYDLLTLLLSLFRADEQPIEQWDRSLAKQAPSLIERYAGGLTLSISDVRVWLPLTLANWFHLQWSDGRKEFTGRMYNTIQHYFDHPQDWEDVFLQAAKR